ncbi:MAG: site-specific integrase [Burkholderiales bacterium]|jgi:integrase|nr:site-specific integrase [Burkholderiales bacterium]
MSIDKLPSGKWRARIYRKGQRKTKTFLTKLDAQEWERMINAEEHAQLVGRPVRGKTLGDVLLRYSEDVSPKHKGARWETMRIARFIREDSIAKIALEELRSEHFAHWRDNRLKDVLSSTVNREWTLMSAAINTAVKEWRWLPNNPMSAVKRPAQPKPRDRRITDDEVERLLYACGYERDTKPETLQSRVGACLLFAIETAMRAGEIVGLTWDRVDLKAQTARLTETKNGTARVVPLSKEAVRIIKQMRGTDENLIFGIGSNQLESLFRKTRDRVLLSDLHFHDSRREALTRLAEKVDAMTLAKISGHRDLRILQSVYYVPNMSDVAKHLN